MKRPFAWLAFTAISAACHPGAPPSPTSPRSTEKPSEPAVCASAPPVDAPAPHKPGLVFSDAERRQIAQDATRFLRTFHVPAEATEKAYGRTLDQELAVAEREVLAADDRAKMGAALHHLGNAIHNGHCRFRPKIRGDRFVLPLRFFADPRPGDAFVFVVDEIADEAKRAGVQVGDELVSADGVEAKDLLSTHRLESNAGTRLGLADDIAGFLAGRRASTSSVRDGDTSRLVLRTLGAAPREITLPFRTRLPQPGDDDDFAIDLDKKGCGHERDVDYGPYAITTRGQRFCVYTSTKAPYAGYPIVRWYSFQYAGDPAAIRADHDILRDALARQTKARGVVFDFRDNGGGNNPSFFVRSLARAPYRDGFVRLLLHPELADGNTLNQRGANMGQAQLDHYKASLAATPVVASPGHTLSPPRACFCPRSGCDFDNVYAPQSPFTKLPFSVLVGPDCGSSCDAATLAIRENRLGTLVGEPTAGAFGTHRIRHELPFDLGTLDASISEDLDARKRPVEGVGVPPDLPLPRSFARRERRDHDLVDLAIAQGFRGHPADEGSSAKREDQR